MRNAGDYYDEKAKEVWELSKQLIDKLEEHAALTEDIADKIEARTSLFEEIQALRKRIEQARYVGD